MNRFSIGKSLAIVGAALAVVSAVPAQAQAPGGGAGGGAAAAAPRPAPIPKSGTVAINPATEEKMRAQVKVPDGFDLTLFAGPPVAMYPSCVAEAPEKVVFVCVDPNLSLSTTRGVGRVMRLVDDNGDGKADRYSTFAEMDSPRGAVFDGQTLYVMHPPTLTAYRDTDGDGISDWSRDIITGLGFDLGFRGADHTTNGVQMGVDGWLYVAVGDYGFQKAMGTDGSAISHRGGAVVRVRPDGSNLEIYATGTRNIYDVAIDPLMHIYSRDNTNDGDGWNTRLHYIPAGAFMGYPTQWFNFASEHFPTMFDYGAGSGVGDLWVQDPAWPEPYRNTLLTADWTVNKVVRNPVTPKGASFAVQQQDFISLSRPSDLIMDAGSNLYVSSLSGGQFNYAGDTIGYVFRVTPAGVSTVAPAVRTLNETQLVALLRSGNAVHRMHAQHELVRRGASAATLSGIEQLINESGASAESRAAAMFTLKQISGARANAAIAQAAKAADPRVRELALRVLADRKDQLDGVSSALFVQALSDADDHVKVQAMNGLARMGAVDAAAAIAPLLGSADQGMSHLAVMALVQLGASTAALEAVDGGPPAVRAGALRVLAQMHEVPVARALLDRMGKTQDATRRRELTLTLARLYNEEAPWAGDWWTTRPAFIGPYFSPAGWEASPLIRPALRQALLSASGDELKTLADAFALNRVLPQGSQSLLVTLKASRDPAFNTLAEAMIGRSTLDPEQTATLAQLSGKSAALKGAVAELVSKQPTQSDATFPLLRSAALDATLPPAVRESALNGIGSIAALSGTQAAAPVFAQVNPTPGSDQDTPVDAAWRRWVGNMRRGQEVDYFIGLANGTDPEQRVLAYSVLLQQIRGARVQPATREKVTPLLEAAWTDPTRAPLLARAVRIMRLEAQYATQLQGVPNR
jgi:putative membrane-bound dehydrogenase-like protein